MPWNATWCAGKASCSLPSGQLRPGEDNDRRARCRLAGAARPWSPAACRRWRRNPGGCMTGLLDEGEAAARWPCSTRCGRRWRRGAGPGACGLLVRAWTTTVPHGKLSITFHADWDSGAGRRAGRPRSEERSA